MKNIQSTFFFFVTILLVTVVGCGPQIQTAAEAGINIELEVMGEQLSVGETTLTVKVTDSSGAAINDAALNIQGDMTHAGMTPVIRDVADGEDGLYTVPFEWTMGGDWIVTVLAVLNDGTEVEENFNLSVDSNGEMAMDGDLASALDALDVSAIHDIDVGVNEDETIDADYAETVDNFMMAVSMVEWPEMHSEDVESLNTTLVSLKEALEAEDLESAQPLATEAHDKAHTLVDMVKEMGGDHDH